MRRVAQKHLVKFPSVYILANTLAPLFFSLKSERDFMPTKSQNVGSNLVATGFSEAPYFENDPFFNCRYLWIHMHTSHQLYGYPYFFVHFPNLQSVYK